MPGSGYKPTVTTDHRSATGFNSSTNFVFSDQGAGSAPSFNNIPALVVSLVDPAAIIVSAPYSAPDQTPCYRSPRNRHRPYVPSPKMGNVALSGQRLKSVSIFCKFAEHGAVTRLYDHAPDVSRRLACNNWIPDLS